jgi:DNA polymerase
MGSMRGTWREYVDGELVIPVMPTFHPAYLLRAYTPENRKKVWSDLQQAMTKISG